jgi:hypothetical protein
MLIPRLRKSATAPASPAPGVTPGKRRLRRLAGVALAATLAVVPTSVVVQNTAVPKAQAAVDDNHPAVLGPAALAVLNYWLNRWPTTNSGRNAIYWTGGGYANGGGAFRDNGNQLTNYIRRVTGNTGQLTFREYDATARNNPNTRRDDRRYVYNPNTGIIFRTMNHYTDFTPINIGSAARFPRTVYCYRFPQGQRNPTRILLINGRSSVINGSRNFGTPGLAAVGVDVSYQQVTEYWDVQGYYYQPAGSRPGGVHGFSFLAHTALTMSRDANAICRQWGSGQYGHF